MTRQGEGRRMRQEANTQDKPKETPDDSPTAADVDEKTLNEQIRSLAKYLDASGIDEYVRLTRRPGKLFMLNFASGVARGLGFTIGTTIVLAVLYKVLSELISMNIPYITEMLREFIEMVQPATGG